MLIPSVGLRVKDFNDLSEGLCDIVKTADIMEIKTQIKPMHIPKMAIKPSEVLFRQIENIDVLEAEGRVSAQAAGTYPPGVCTLVPGEYIDKNVLEDLLRCKTGKIAVIKEKMI